MYLHFLCCEGGICRPHTILLFLYLFLFTAHAACDQPDACCALLAGCLLGSRPVAFGPFAIRMFTGHSNYAHALTGSNPSCFRMKTKGLSH